MKIALLMKFMGIQPMTVTFLYVIQSLNAIPSIQSFYDGVLAESRNKHGGKDLVLCGGSTVFCLCLIY